MNANYTNGSKDIRIISMHSPACQRLSDDLHININLLKSHV